MKPLKIAGAPISWGVCEVPGRIAHAHLKDGDGAMAARVRTSVAFMNGVCQAGVPACVTV